MLFKLTISFGILYKGFASESKVIDEFALSDIQVEFGDIIVDRWNEPDDNSFVQVQLS